MGNKGGNMRVKDGGLTLPGQLSYYPVAEKAEPAPSGFTQGRSRVNTILIALTDEVIQPAFISYGV